MLLFTLLACLPKAIPPEGPGDDASPVSFAGALRETAPPPQLEPNAQDHHAFERLEASVADLDDPALAAELAPLFEHTSQTFLAAVATPLFQAGVVNGNPGIIQLACDSEAKVSYSAFRRARDLNDLRAACLVLQEAPSSDGACGVVRQHLQEGYQLLARGDETNARARVADAVRHSTGCTGVTPLPRAPVEPSSRGFVVLSALHGLGAPPATFLAGQTRPPQYAAVIDNAFLDNQKLLE